jgi:phage tail sheath protein FI
VYEARLRRLLEEATASAAFERRGPDLWKQVERVAGAVMHREQAAGRCRGFRVRCDAETNAADAEGVTFEVAYLPPHPRARTVVIAVVVRAAG